MNPKSLAAIPCLYVLILLAGTMWPYNFRQENGVIPGRAEGMVFDPPATAYASGAGSKLGGLTSFTILVSLTPHGYESNGYARILTWSLDDDRRNFMIGQWNESLVFKLKMSGRDKPIHFETEGVFIKDRKTTLAIAFDGERLLLYKDGMLRRARRTAPLTPGPWEGTYPLVVGSEGNGKSPWKGSVERIAIFDRLLSRQEISTSAGPDGAGGLDPLIHYDLTGAPRTRTRHAMEMKDSGRPPAADLFVPARFAPFQRTYLGSVSLKWEDLRHEWDDILLNIAVFIPLGVILFGFLFRWGVRPGLALALAVMAGFLLSLSVELLQAWLPTRNSSLMDVITNTLGTAVGAGIGTRLRSVVKDKTR